MSCVIMGAKEAELTVFPREAMAELQPYPFGLDPVRYRLYFIMYLKYYDAFIPFFIGLEFC